MVPEDIWRTEPANAETRKVIDHYDAAKPALVVARRHLDLGLRAALMEALVEWVTP